MKHCGTPNIETPRLLLRAFEYSDAGDMLKNWIADPKVQSEYGEPVYSAPMQVKALLDKWISGYAGDDFYRWAVIEKESGENIGQIAFCRVYEDCRTAEIEYCIGMEFCGRGYAGEALAAVVDFAFANTEFERLEAYHRKENIRSGRVLEKSPMHVTGNVQRFARENKVPCGEVCYCITREEWKQMARNDSES